MIVKITPNVAVNPSHVIEVEQDGSDVLVSTAIQQHRIMLTNVDKVLLKLNRALSRPHAQPF